MTNVKQSDDDLIFDRLSAPFEPDQVHWRVGSMTRDKKRGMALAYLDSRAVMDRLDDVLGLNWECTNIHMGADVYCCEIAITINGVTRRRSNGAGATEIEGIKGGFSDAFKRAAVMWGIGRYLYDIPTPWVELDDHKRIRNEEQTKLRKILEQHTTGVRAKSPHAFRDAFKSLADQINNSDTLDRMEAVLSTPAHRSLISQMPPDWAPHFDELLERKRERLLAQRAA